MCDLAVAPTRDGVDRQFQSPLCIAHQPCCDQSPHDLQPWETQPLYRVNASFRGDQIHPRVWRGGTCGWDGRFRDKFSPSNFTGGRTRYFIRPSCRCLIGFSCLIPN
ncbi:hypothetical protein T12_3592 [Trichinella patagoniensis]|uniref:Uncharacterized protein n=1 Tax=Trichinella patagoniensis TaxID=990121 RepID=A0A0V0Z3N3_9BILA|nr:hypothetical protein T12_3592 [Trichinella patagoniensis]